MNEYKSTDIRRMFDMSNENVRRWCDAFGEWLSDGATPPKGRTRIFNDDDLAVFAYAADSRKQGMSIEEIADGLAVGNRSDAEPYKLIDSAPDAKALAAIYETRIFDLEAERDTLRDKLETIEQERDTLRSERDELRGQLNVLPDQDAIIKLERKIAVLEYQLEQLQNED